MVRENKAITANQTQLRLVLAEVFTATMLMKFNVPGVPAGRINTINVLIKF